MLKKAMILAAGFGKRVKPLTQGRPKPLLKIGNETLLSNTIKFLKSYGIKKIVINIHYLAEQIIHYIDKNNFDLDISLVEEKNKILDTGGGILNAIQHFENDPFLIMNPDTIWSSDYLEEIKLMENIFFKKKSKCSLLLVRKDKCHDESLKGDFNLENNLNIKRDKNELKYIYTGAQIISPDVFKGLSVSPFSINKIWDELIREEELFGVESQVNFLHVSTLDIYKKLSEKNFKH